MNSVDVIGYLHETNKDCYRKLQISMPSFNEDGLNTMTILTKYWAGGTKNYLLSLPNGSHVAIHGHLDYSEKFGTILVVEQLYCLKKQNENT